MRGPPYFFKYRRSRTFQLFAGRYDLLDFVAKLVDARISMLPGIDQRLFVKWPNDSLDVREFQEAGACWNQQPDAELDGRTRFAQSELGERAQQVEIAFECGPRRKGDEGRLENQADFPKGFCNVDKVGAGVALVELGQDFIVQRLDGAGHKQTLGIAQLAEVPLVPAQMFDFDGDVVRELREFVVQGLDNRHRMADAVEKIWIAEGDVLRARNNLLSDVGQNHFAIHHPENPLVNRHNRPATTK